MGRILGPCVYLGSAPGRALRTVFDHDAHLRELAADFIGSSPVARLFGFDALGNELVDGGFIYNDTDTSLLDILYQDEPMTMGGM